MNCQQCLEELSTASLREMQPDSPVMQHCATCADCSRLTTMLREREYEAATLLNSLPPMSSPLSVAEGAAAVSNRRRVGRFVVMLSGIAGAIIIWVVGATTILPALKSIPGVEGGQAAGGLRTETIALSCLSAQQAGDIINPYVRSRGSNYYMPSSGIPAITVRGTPDELARSRDLIAEFEHNPTTVCANPVAGLKGKQKLADTLSIIDVKPVIAPDVAPTTTVAPAPTKK
jgi:hypothetical protein